MPERSTEPRGSRTGVVRAAGRVGLFLGAPLLVLLLFEGALQFLAISGMDEERWRTRGLHKPDPELIYSLRPSSHSEWVTTEFVERARTNSHGLRGPEIARKKGDSVRILILGDSTTFGHGVDVEESYPWRLGELLGKGVEVINAGTKGYGTDHSYKLFMLRLRKLAPDILIFAVSHNDFEDNMRFPLFELESGRLVALDATQSPLYRVARFSDRLPDFLAESRTARWAIPLGVELSSRPVESNDSRLIRYQADKFSLQLAALSKAANGDDFRLIVLGLPFRHGPRKLFRSIRVDTRTAFLDLTRDTTWQAQKERWFFEHDEHLNAAGHERVAAILGAYIKQRAWVEAKP